MPKRRLTRRLLGVPALAIVLFMAGPSLEGYSVLSHEAVVDSAWDPAIKPLLLRLYPTASDAQLREAHAYAYGGCIIQDMGYYPFGNRFVSDLTHYVRSGDFVDALFTQAQNMYEFAFALGAFAHYTADNNGHPIGVNPSVGDTFPRLKAKYGKVVTYEDDPAAHLMVEFSFDVAQIVASHYTPETYNNFIGFKVAQAQLERAFHETYGLDFKSLFLSEDLAIGTFRRGAGQVIPEMTSVAWKHNKAEILKANPQMTRGVFVYRLSRRDYRSEFGGNFSHSRFGREVWGGGSDAKPGLLARFLVFLTRILPKVGPLRTLRFKAPTPQTDALFLASFQTTTERYHVALSNAGWTPPPLPDTNLDTGKPTRAGDYSLADKTYAKLLDKLAAQNFAGITAELKTNVLGFYSDANAAIATEKNPKDRQRLQAEVERLRTAPLGSAPSAAGSH
jgi:Zinc dependent phospholipase C